MSDITVDSKPRTFSIITYFGFISSTISKNFIETFPLSSLSPKLFPALEKAWQGGPPTMALISDLRNFLLLRYFKGPLRPF